MYRFKKYALIAMAALGVQVAMAQVKTLSGTVSDENNLPLAGTTVMVEGTTNGTMADEDGKWSLTAEVGQTLLFDYLGYEPQSVLIGKSSVYNIKMRPSSEMMEELVVVGYGVQKKVNVTGAVATVDYSELSSSRPITSTATLLQGASAGLYVKQTSGLPGSEGVSMKIRGTGTLNSGANPLVIIDGFEGTLDYVDAKDIQTISVLKDAASCAIYGNRGANGVILITTKNPKEGNFNIEYEGVFAYQSPQSHFDLISNYADYMEIMNESAENVNQAPIFSPFVIEQWREAEKDPYGLADSGYPNYVAYPNTDWMDAMYNNSFYQRHTVSSSGSSKRIRYNMSLSYYDNPGTMDLTGLKRFSYRANVSSQVKDWLELGMRFYGYRQDVEEGNFTGSVSSQWMRMIPGIYPYYDGKYGWMECDSQDSNSRNNLYFLHRNRGNSTYHYANATAYTVITLPFDIKYKASFNYTARGKHSTSTGYALNAWSFSQNKIKKYYEDLTQITIYNNQSRFYNWTFQTDLSWAKTIGKHDISAMVGFEAFDYTQSDETARKKNVANNVLRQLNNALELDKIEGDMTDYSAMSVFGRATYAYDEKYMAEVNLRYDGSSRFAKESRWGIFPSVSAGWRISEEGFMQGSGIDNLKLRASWGMLGNNAVGNYEWQSLYDVGYDYAFGNTLTSGAVATLSNQLLQWETTTSIDVGLDLAVFQNRLTFEADWYRKYTDGILYAVPIYATIGNKAAPVQNQCAVSNHGIELTLGWRDSIGDFSYGISGNFTRNWNRVEAYKGALQAGWVTGEDGIRTYKTNIGDVSTQYDGVYRTVEGRQIKEYHLLNLYHGTGNHFFEDGSVNPAGGPKDGMIRTEDDMAWLRAMVEAGNEFLPNKNVDKTGIWYGDYIYSDENGDGIYGGADDYTFQNISQTPTLFYGFNIDMSYKGFDLSVRFAGAGGAAKYWRYVGLSSYGTSKDYTLRKDIAYDHYFYDPDRPDDPRTNLTSKNGRLTLTASKGQSESPSTLWLFKTDYLKLQNVTLGYNFPRKWMNKIGIEGLRIYLSGENLYTFTDYPGMDPAYDSASNYYPQIRQLTMGVNLKF